MNYPVSANEAERLRTLRSYKILETKPEERFDELTRLAALICGVPISLISLIDTDRQPLMSASRSALMMSACCRCRSLHD